MLQSFSWKHTRCILMMLFYWCVIPGYPLQYQYYLNLSFLLPVFYSCSHIALMLSLSTEYQFIQACNQGGFEGFDRTPLLYISVSLMCGQIHWMVWIEDLVSISIIVPSVSFHYCHLIFTGGCNSSTIQPTVANPRQSWTPLHECLATYLSSIYGISRTSLKGHSECMTQSKNLFIKDKFTVPTEQLC